MLFQVENLACRRSLRLVFKNVSFALEGGAALLATGPNGSGKSTLLRVLAGLLPAVQGAIYWSGGVVDWADHRARLHYIGHHDAVKPELTVTETLDYWHALRPGRVVHSLPVGLGLDALRDRPLRILSAGQRRRLALARLAMDDAPLWLLDEPATSLDHAGLDTLIHLIEQHRAKGGIAIIAAHHGMNLPGAQALSLAGEAA
jgi:heme exporter protein A